MVNQDQERDPAYVISVAARMVGLHAQTLRSYERVGLVTPERPRGNRRLYSLQNIERLRQIKGLLHVGVNLAGVEMILRMREQMARMEGALGALEEELYRLRREGQPALLAGRTETERGRER